MLLVNRSTLYLRREWLAVVLTVACGLLALDFVAGPLGLRDLIALRERRAQLETMHKELLKSNSALRLKLARLGNDDRYLERRIRAQLGYVRPDELVYRFATDGLSEDRQPEH